MDLLNKELYLLSKKVSRSDLKNDKNYTALAVKYLNLLHAKCQLDKYILNIIKKKEKYN